MTRFSVYLYLFLLSLTTLRAQSPSASAPTVIQLEPGERWWGGLVADAQKAPFGGAAYAVNLYANNQYSQAQPLLLSNHGRWVWSEEPFAFAFAGNTLTLSQAHGPLKQGRAGQTLAEAYRHVSRTFFPPTGQMPDSLLFARPQWNTWIELTYNQNQADVLRYAKAVLANGFQPGVLMIDDTWQEDYGVWTFHPARFPDPKAMMDSLHRMGFKVMLWVCPFVSADSKPFRGLRKQKALLLDNPGGKLTNWTTAQSEPALIRWWNGASAVLDFTNPTAVAWFSGQLAHLRDAYGVDGFKLDAGDPFFYPDSSSLSRERVLPNRHTELFAQFGLQYPLNEYRAMWKQAGQPLAQRLADKNHNWEDLQKLVPQITVQGLLGYAFTCPDMIGGGEYQSFLTRNDYDQDLVVRSAQCHALMPMMQFSVAPWRILDPAHMKAVQGAVALRRRMTGRIMSEVRQSARTGEPTVRHLDYVFPNQGFAAVNDQFMIGQTLLVAPMVEKGKTSRTVLLPKGTWRADDGKTLTGPTRLTLDVPLDRLPYFELVKP